MFGFTFRIHVSAGLPQVDYVTKLDKYIMANFVLCALNVVAAGTLQHAAEEDIEDVSGRPKADLAVLGVLAAVWLLIQACYTVSMHIAWRRRMRPMQKAEATEKEEATAQAEATAKADPKEKADAMKKERMSEKATAAATAAADQ